VTDLRKGLAKVIKKVNQKRRRYAAGGVKAGEKKTPEKKKNAPIIIL